MAFVPNACRHASPNTDVLVLEQAWTWACGTHKESNFLLGMNPPPNRDMLDKHKHAHMCACSTHEKSNSLLGMRRMLKSHWPGCSTLGPMDCLRPISISVILPSQYKPVQPASVCACACVLLCMWLRMRVHVCMCMRLRDCMRVHVCVRVCVCVYACGCACVCASMHARVHVCACASACVIACTNVCVPV